MMSHCPKINKVLIHIHILFVIVEKAYCSTCAQNSKFKVVSFLTTFTHLMHNLFKNLCIILEYLMMHPVYFYLTYTYNFIS